MIKRGFDIVLSAIGLIITAPVMLVCALLVKATSPGPVLYRSQRIGQQFRPFEILKFRSMRTDQSPGGLPITAGGDARITPVGRVLRKLKLDELPQLINVLRGDMSFVGPRPEAPKYVELFHHDYEYLLRVRPGITDPASLKYRDEESVLAASNDPEQLYIQQVLPEKIAISKEYIDHASLSFDLKLIFATLLRIVSPSKAAPAK